MSNVNGSPKADVQPPVVTKTERPMINESGLFQFRLDAQKTPSTPPASARKRVMTCLDGSALAECVLPLSSFMASALDAELTLLHVIPAPENSEPLAFDVLDWEISRRESEEYLTRKHAELTAHGGLATEQLRHELTQGRPAARLLAVEQELTPSLTVLCRRGAGSSPHGGLGATAQQVVGGVRGSVLLVPAGMTPVVPPKRIMIALDGSFRAESVFPMAQAIAARVADAELILVHVVTEPCATGVLSDPEDMKMATLLASHMEVSGASYLHALTERLSSTLPRIKSCVVRHADIRAALLDTARSEKADMIILSAHGSVCNAEHSFGSVAAHVLQYASIPVLAVQDLPGPPSSLRERRDGWTAQ